MDSGGDGGGQPTYLTLRKREVPPFLMQFLAKTATGPHKWHGPNLPNKFVDRAEGGVSLPT